MEFVNSVIRPDIDKATVISFDTGVELVADLTGDPEELAEAIRSLRPGGGTALLKCQGVLDTLSTENPDEAVGIQIVRRALEAPTRQIAENAGVDGSIVIEKVRGTKSKKSWLSKNNWVIRKSTPAAALCRRLARSSSMSAMAGRFLPSSMRASSASISLPRRHARWSRSARRSRQQPMNN